MTFYPQTSNGSVCQFPIEKTLQYRTITNSMEDGSRIVLQDANSSAIRWTLNYSGLTDTELASYQSFFASMSGRLQNFTFFDPSGNLLTWSEDFSQTAWQKSTFLQCQTGITDPLGTQRATSVTNSGSGDLALAQSVSVPGSYLCCFSFFAQSPNQTSIALTRGSFSQSFPVSNVWQRVFLSTTTSDGENTSTFGVTIPAGSQLNLFGMQVEPQAQPSTYVQTLDRSGVYQSTRFDSDSLPFKSDAPNSNSCEITLYSRLPL
jgi:hypothetical protein